MQEIEKEFKADRFYVLLKAEEEEAGMRLDVFAGLFLATFSRAKIQKKIKKKEIFINARKESSRASSTLLLNDQVTIVTMPETEEKFDISRVYEDDEIIVINKPAGIITHPAGRNLFNAATVILEQELKQKMYSVHRLDKETSGAMIMAKNAKASNFYSTLFEDSKVKKVYFLICYKNSDLEYPLTAKENMGLVEGSIPANFMYCFEQNGSRGKTAATTFHLLETFANFQVMLAMPQTGRQHQIRSHAYHHKISLIGDKIYHPKGPEYFLRFQDSELTEQDHRDLILPRQALHCVAMSMPSMQDSENHIFRAPLPTDLIEFLAKYEITTEELNLKIDRVIEDFF